MFSAKALISSYLIMTDKKIIFTILENQNVCLHNSNIEKKTHSAGSDNISWKESSLICHLSNIRPVQSNTKFLT